jgi:5-methylcytosine-specific restriction endonuclease McrA
MAILSPLRRCGKCGKLKLVTSFHRDRTRPDGYCPYCKVCRTTYSSVREPDSVRSCRRCGERKSISDFHRDRTMPDGLNPYCKVCVKVYQRANADAQNQYGHDWQQANTEKVRRYSREWAQRNREFVSQRGRLYRARKAGAEGTFTRIEWLALADWFGNACLACGRTDIHIDHVVPLIRGGTNWLENLQPLCPSCNTSKKDKTIDYRDPARLAAFFRIYYGVEDP